MRHLSEDELACFAMDAMEPQERAQASAHLHDCARCQAGLLAEQALEDRLHAAYETPAPQLPAEPSRTRLGALFLGLALAAGALLSLDTQSTNPPAARPDPSLGMALQPPDDQAGRYLMLPQDFCRDCGKPSGEP